MRGDRVNPGLLGIDGTLSEDVVRQAMMRINETQGLEWLTQQVVSSIAPELKLPWILDIDVTFKPPYAHQQGADWDTIHTSPEGPATCIKATLSRT